MNEESSNNSFKNLIIIAIVVGTILVISLVTVLLLPKFLTKTTEKINTNSKKPQAVNTTKEEKEWKEHGVVIPGNYADAEIIKTDTGYRIFYGLEPEVKGFKNQVYTATSKDGLAWTGQKEIMTGVTFPSVIKTADGYRMYYQGMAEGLGVQAIMSAISKDGETWTKEEGARLSKPGKVGGVTIENIAAPTVEKLKDGTYIMVFRGSFEKKYTPLAPNNDTSLLFTATSDDGLTFKAKNIAVDTRNEEMIGMADGPEFYIEGDNMELYWWGYKGVYKVTYKDGVFGKAEKPDLEPFGKDPNVMFAPNPPGDPTLIKIESKLYLYYGQHEKGIYLATKG